jgi:hypothetical protein
MYEVDNLVIGAGIFGCHAATVMASSGKTLIIEELSDIMDGVTRWNHGRVHNGLHYLNDYETAKQANDNYQRFILDNSSAINNSFEHFYAIDRMGSKSNSDVFEKTATSFGIQYVKAKPKFLKNEHLESVYSLKEPTFDILELKRLYRDRLLASGVEVFTNSKIIEAKLIDEKYLLKVLTSQNNIISIVINKNIMIAAYSKTNNVLGILGLPQQDVTYVLGRQSYGYVPDLKNTALTVVDGDFISLAPFGFSGLHAINSPPHTNFVYASSLKDFENVVEPTERELYNKIINQSHRYFNADGIYMHSSVKYIKALFDYSKNPESRKTSIRMVSSSPRVYAIISGKISNVYEINKIDIL